MNLTTWLDVAIGLTLIFLGTSLLVTVINEYVAQMLNLRGKNLCASLEKLIDNETVKAELSKNPALKPFFGGGKTLSYVDPNVLARMLLGTLDATLNAGSTVKEIGAAIDKLADTALKTQLQALVRTAGDKVEDLVTSVSAWADRSLTMLGEVYKKRLQMISLGIGFGVAVVFNVDALALTRHLYRDKEAREATVAVAVRLAEQTDSAAFGRCIRLPNAQRETDPACVQVAGLIGAVRGRNDSLGVLPLGRSGTFPANFRISFSSMVGWMLTALAVSVGAPFWFDLLNKFVNIRHAMRKPEVKAAGDTV